MLQAILQLQQVKTRAETANKVALETGKGKDVAEKAVMELKRQLQPKRALSHDDAGDAHECHHVMLFFSVSRCDEALCQKAIQLLVQGVLACARTRSWIPVE